MTQAKVDERINTIITDAVDGDNLTNLTELVKYLKEHGEEAADLIVKVQSLEENKADKEHTHKQYLTSDALSILDNYAEKAHNHTEYAYVKHEHEEYLKAENLEGYAKQSDIITDYNQLENLPKILDIENDNLATKTYVNETVANAITSGSIDLSDYALKADLDGYATEEFVREEIKNSGHMTIADLQIGENFTTDIKVGHLEAGFEVKATMTFGDLLKRILRCEHE
jgi:hypothetical protein